MKEIYETSLVLIHSITRLNGFCNQFKEIPTDDNGEKIIELVDKCEEKFLKVKEEIVIMVNEVETNKSQLIEQDQEIFVTKTDGGFLINDKD